MSSSPNARLDVESSEDRQERLARLLATQEDRTPALPVRPTTFRVAPPSELLSRLQAFLPQMAAANEELAQRPAADMDIENVGEDQEQYVEMDLGLGVFNARMKGEEGASSSSDETSSSEDESDDSDSSSDDDNVPAALRIKKDLKSKTKGALIEMLDDGAKPEDGLAAKEEQK